ncbi:hypothetical protein V7S43_004676 [Phytophthora oleae]|uniref:Endothelin-converting enzyme 1 n=1 Tax=Phytophthora oleae TaxID=2107226 RepID=A0ABD3FTW7_9STRA
METYKDPSVDPCVDFYEYACGGWLKTHEIPSDRPSIDSSFYVVSETNKDTIQKIFDQNPPQIGQLYHSCLNDQEVDAEAVHFVSQLIENIHQANSTVALMGLAGEMDQSLGISTFFSIFVGADPEDPSTNVPQFAQGGLTLPSREYYLEESKVDAYATLYVDYVTKLFAVGGLDSHNVTEYAEAVLEIETALAKISLSNAALRDPWTTNKAYPFAEIATRYPFLMAYLNGIYKLEPFPMLHGIVATPDFFEAQTKLLSDESLLPQLKSYLSFHLIDSFGAVLGEYFRRASHEFHGKIQGAGALLPRDQFCVRLTTAFLGDELGKYYMDDVFGPVAKAAAQALVAEIEESLKALLLTEAWLDIVTHDAAVEKLNKVKNYIGGPDDVPPLPFELQADAFFNNVKSLMQLSAAGTIKSINQPVDEQAWDMFPSTVNAYYDPSANKMVFPAAILQPPFYSAEHFPAAANFARIGMVMGHELSHGFDDQGRNYDGNGALRSWWTPSVSAEFAEKAQCLAAQYSSFPVVSIEDGHVLGMVNGNLTLGENIADNGGIHLAYEAYHLWKSTFATPSPPVEPAETPSPVVPIPDVPVPEPTETGPGGEIPAVTSPPVLPVPEAETPEPAQTEPSGEIPVATPAQSPVIPEPEPTNIGPGGVIPEETSPAPELPVPEEQTPAPTETEPPTEAPVKTQSPPTVPTPPVVPDVPDTPTPPNVPDIPTPPVPTPPPVIVPPQPESTTKAPKHEKKKEEPTGEPEEKEHDRKHRKDESEKDKKKGKSESSEDGKSHKHGEKKDDGKKSQGSKHDHDNRYDKDDIGKSKKDSGDEKKEDRHSHEEGPETKDEDSKKHKKHSDNSKEDDESSTHHGKTKHRHEDENERDSGRKHHHGNEEEAEDKNSHEDEDYDRKPRHHEKREEEGERHKHDHREYESRHERRAERHRRDEERGEDEDSGHHTNKHHGHEEYEDRGDEEDHGHHGKRSYRWDEDEGESDRRKHHKHDKKEEKRERKERKQQRKADEVFEGKHHHRWDYDDDGYDEDREWRRHGKHRHHEEEREERWECGDCGREHEHHRHKHERDWGKDWKYPFSGGNVKIHSMIEKLARAIAQPNDPVADDRLFFTAFAQNWCEKRTPGYAELLRTIDPHSPGKWRVNGPLMNYDKFAEVFSCPVGMPMNPEKKCVIW